jgi:peptidoglycan/LPS O-acetylase OafA/YrhL
VRSHEFRADVEGLRAIAVLAVLGYHFFPGYLPGGYLGVEVVFVISGFLITGTILRSAETGRFSLCDFYARRIRRLFPAMLLVLAASLAAATVLLFSFELLRFAQHITASLLFFENFLLASELGYFDNDARGKPLLHFWSLAVEEQFYIAWPVLAVFGAGGRRSRVAILAIAILAVSLFYVFGHAQGREGAFFDPLARAWELAVGAGLAARPLSGSSSRPRLCGALSLASLAILVACPFWPVPDDAHPGWATLVPVLATGCAIGCGPAASANRLVLSLSPAVAVGRISYPLYLWHWPLLAFPFYVAGDKPSGGVRLALLALSFVLAAATWHFAERPLRRRADIRRTALTLLGLALGLLAATWAVVAGREALPDEQASRVEAQLEGSRWAFVSNATCLRRYRPAPDYPFCMLSHDADPTMILVGNSYANHLYHGFASDSRTRGRAILSYGSCNLLESASTPECRAQTAAVRAARGRKVLVISALWPDFAADGTALNPVSRAPAGTDAAIFERDLRGWIAEMAAPGVAIVIIGPKPELAYDVADCFARPFRAATQDCRVPATDLRHQAATRQLLRQIAATTEQAHYVDIFDIFCGLQTCSYIDKSGLPLLRDNGHLSREGSKRAVARILDRLEAEGLPLAEPIAGARR